MRNKFKNLILVFILAVSLPFVSFLTGCGATPSNEITGIAFDSMIYDEETGLPVFEVDKGLETSLTYKIYPSTAVGYRVYFDPVDKGTAENSSRFTFQDGVITVNSNSFEDVRYKVRAGDFSDTCIIRLKEYPVEIFTDETTIIANKGEVVPINVKAKFINDLGVVSIRNITEKDFDFLVETSDETMVKIENSERLKFFPVRNNSTMAEVSVTLLNGNGEPTNMSFKINVQVVQNVKSAFVEVSGVDSFVENNGIAKVNFEALEEDLEDSNYKKIDFNIYPINVGNLLIEDNFEYSVYVTSKKYAKVTRDGKSVLMKKTVNEDYEIGITIIISEFSKSDGSAFSIEMTLIIDK